MPASTKSERDERLCFGYNINKIEVNVKLSFYSQQEWLYAGSSFWSGFKMSNKSNLNQSVAYRLKSLKLKVVVFNY